MVGASEGAKLREKHWHLLNELRLSWVHLALAHHRRPMMVSNNLEFVVFLELLELARKFTLGRSQGPQTFSSHALGSVDDKDEAMADGRGRSEQRKLCRLPLAMAISSRDGGSVLSDEGGFRFGIEPEAAGRPGDGGR